MEILTKQELCNRLNLAYSTIGHYQTQGMPVHFRGKRGQPSTYVLHEVEDWIKENINSLSKGASSLNEAKLEKLQIDIQLAELELQKEQGTVVEIDEAVYQVEKAFTKVRAKLLAMPSELSGILLSLQTQKEVHAELEASVLRILEELVSDFTNGFDDDEYDDEE